MISHHVGVCVMPFHCWWDWIRNGLLFPGETKRQVCMGCGSIQDKHTLNGHGLFAGGLINEVLL